MNKRALISVFNKKGILDLALSLTNNNIEIISTGGTKLFLEENNINVIDVEDITNFPSIFDGRVKTLHPNIFGGILMRRENQNDLLEAQKNNIIGIDYIIVDLYPFEDTVNNSTNHDEIIEKIDIGGVSLIRAAAKNYKYTTIISSKSQYNLFLNLLNNENDIDLESRKQFAIQAFNNTYNYDKIINEYLLYGKLNNNSYKLRYGENPHQDAYYKGDFYEIFDIISGKELSYNNILDVDSALNLMFDFKYEKPTFAIIKHNNTCGIATRDNIYEAYKEALSCDPLSAFGGILISNFKIDIETAKLINKLFFEIIIAPYFEKDALNLLQSKKDRRILNLKQYPSNNQIKRSAINGILIQNKDLKNIDIDDLKLVTQLESTPSQLSDLIFANKISKHTKSNTIVLVKDKKLLGSGTGQTSRVDALIHAIDKAKKFGFTLKDAVMASDAFFPFPDCVEIAQKEGVMSVIQPGGSIKDELSIDFCNNNNMSMYFSGIRHFKH